MVSDYHGDLRTIPFLNLDFTGECFDSVAKCNEVGLRFSDVDTPFPDSIRGSITGGTWTHSTGNGWQPACTNNDQGPAILIPLKHSTNFQVETVWDVSAANAAHQILCEVGSLTSSNHVPAVAETRDATAAQVRYTARLRTNDGDDSFTLRYTGTDMDGASEWQLYFRSFSGCVSIWDDQDNAWHDYTGHQSTTSAYVPAYAFVQVRKLSEAAMAIVRLASLKLIYLV